MKMKPNMKNKKIKTIVMASTIIGIIGLVYGTIYTTETYAQTKATPVHITGISNQNVQYPNAVLAKGKATDVITGVSLTQFSQTSKALRADDSKEPRASTEDTNIALKMYSGKKDTKDIVAVTLTNTSPKAITVNVFVISGFLRGDVAGSHVESVYRPAISDASDVAGATTTIPQVLAPGESMTSYIQDVLNAEGYTGMACYSYDPTDPTTHYCTSMPITWLQ